MLENEKEVKNTEAEVSVEKEVKEKTVYEISFLIDPKTSEEDLPLAVGGLKEVIESRDSIFVSEGLPKKMNLAYSMFTSHDSKKERYDSAYFGWIKYEASPSDIEEIKNEMEAKKEVIRLLVVKTTREDISPFKPKPVVASKPEGKGPISISKAELDKTIENLVIE